MADASLRPAGAAHTALMAALAAAPWCYGSALEPVRYGLAAFVLAVSAMALWAGIATARALTAPCAALMAWGLIQLLWSGARVLTLESLLLLAATLAVILFWAAEGRDDARARRLAYAILALCAVQATFAVVQAHLAPRTIYGRHLPYALSPFGSFENHNHFAGLMEMGVLLALALAFGRAKRVGRVDPRAIGFAGLSLALAAAHLGSRSRGGLLALLAGGAALLFLWRIAFARRDTMRRDLAIGAGMLALLLLFGWLAVPAQTRAHLSTAFRGATDASGHYRLSMAAATLRLWWDNPLLGSGLGTFADEVTRFKRSDGLVRVGHAESDALEWLAEGGLVGLALVGWLAAAVGRGFLDRVREGRDPTRKALAVGAMAAVLALVAHSFFDFNLRIPSNALVFCALLGLAGAPRTEPPPQSPAVRRILGALFLLLAIAAAWRAWGAIELRAAQESVVAEERLARLSRVLSRHPYLSEAWRDRSHVRWQLARGEREAVAYRLNGAFEDTQGALALRPRYSFGWADAGWLHYMRGDGRAAEEAFDRAIELDPANVVIGLARADFYSRGGRLDEARQELRRIRRYNLDWPESAAEAMARRMGLGSLK